MQNPHTFVALYDASPEHAHFESPILSSRARALGRALGKAGIGVISRAGSPVVMTVIDSLSDAGISPVTLSPGANRGEHEHAYRLPKVPGTLIFTGRGAMGADIMAIASAHAILISGSYPETLANILHYAKDNALPIAILTDEDSSSVHELVRKNHPQLAPRLLVSHDEAEIVKLVSQELRRQRFN